MSILYSINTLFLGLFFEVKINGQGAIYNRGEFLRGILNLDLKKRLMLSMAL